MTTRMDCVRSIRVVKPNCTGSMGRSNQMGPQTATALAAELSALQALATLEVRFVLIDPQLAWILLYAYIHVAW